MNQRPSGYEPDELPDCSIPRYRALAPETRRKYRRILKTPKGLPVKVSPLTSEWVFPALSLASMPGGDLLFHALRHSTIGAIWFHGRVRDGIGWVTDAMTTKQWGQRKFGFKSMQYGRVSVQCYLGVSGWRISPPQHQHSPIKAKLSLTVRTLKHDQNY